MKPKLITMNKKTRSSRGVTDDPCISIIKVKLENRRSQLLQVMKGPSIQKHKGHTIENSTMVLNHKTKHQEADCHCHSSMHLQKLTQSTSK
jgi:hypothetical protein